MCCLWAAKEAIYKTAAEKITDYKNQIEIESFELKKNSETVAFLKINGTFAVYKLIIEQLDCNHFAVLAY